MSAGNKISDADWAKLKERISESDYRGEIDLEEEEFAYIESRGMDMLVNHAQDFVKRRLGPAKPRNEGKQTPLKGHPIFLAQHATGADSRAALAEFHDIPEGRKLTKEEREYVADLILRWLNERLEAHNKQ